jgi:hypothetical protein
LSQVIVRPATDDDWPALWPIVEAVVRTGETYTYPRDLTESAARTIWMQTAPGMTLVAVDGDRITAVEADLDGRGRRDRHRPPRPGAARVAPPGDLLFGSLQAVRSWRMATDCAPGSIWFHLANLT